jgi:hypothetical protein
MAVANRIAVTNSTARVPRDSSAPAIPPSIAKSGNMRNGVISPAKMLSKILRSRLVMDLSLSY